MDVDATKYLKPPHPSKSIGSTTSATQHLLPLSLNEENTNYNLDADFSATLDHTSTYSPNTTTSFHSLEPYNSNSDLEFSAEFSPETLTRENASSVFSHGRGGLYEVPQLWQDLACVPFKEDEIARFRMGVNTCLSVADLDLGLGVGTYKGEGTEVGSALGTADEAFWVKSTTRRPAPGTEWGFWSRVGCAGKGKEWDGFAWCGQGEGGLDDVQKGEERGERGRKEMAVERLKSVLAHLAA